MVLSLNTGTFLVLLLSLKPYVLLAQLLFLVMVLLDEAFHSHGESLNLSFEGGSMQFVSLIIVGGRYRASKYHATVYLRSDMAYKMVFPTDSSNR